jgi:S-adenosylmethionine:tRNA ribosyltransferase-isomerase
LHAAGAVPLPPYIKRAPEASDAERYQTVYSHFEGAVAAPTAGLHFTDDVLARLRSKGIASAFLTLHVSAGTFMPVKTEDALQHPMHREQVIIKKQVVEGLLTKRGNVVAVGTTAVRTLESLYWFGAKLLKDADAAFSIASMDPYELEANAPPADKVFEAILQMMHRNTLTELIGETAIYIVPGYRFKVCQGLVTNFHQPGSTLLLLIAAFVGPDWKKIYTDALSKGYRFLSYGDSSLLLPSTISK